MSEETKRCPLCYEEIHVKARKCKHCGSMLDEQTSATPPGGPFDGDRTQMPGEIKRVLGRRYELQEELGRGGMGIVYRALDTKLETEVAIKLLPEFLARDERGVGLLKKEALASMRLSHPNILRLHNFEDYSQDKFLIMELVDGNTLEQILHASPERRLSEEQTIKYAIEICRGLEYAHGENVIHRDIKPSNIMVDANDRVKISDFGIARVLKDSHTRHTGMLTSGTLLYMSPEQCTGKSSALSDIYSLGMSIYELLAGRTPFEDAVDITYCHKHEPVKPIEGISDRLNEIILGCVAKVPEDRWQSARQLMDALTGRTKAQPEQKDDPRIEVVSDQLEEEQTADKKLLETFTNSIGMEFVLIPAGSFMMGSPEGEGLDREHPQHKVTITQPFYMGTTPITQAQWKAVMGNNPSRFKGDDLPVENVSWLDTQEFIKKLNKREGGNKYRLPTEAEWEYACRAGSSTKYCFGDSESGLGDYAWYSLNAGGTHPVGEKSPNQWGLYDMHGNVWEWCSDWYDSGYYSKSPSRNPDNQTKAQNRVIRGGSRNNAPKNLRSANRYGNTPGYGSRIIGLRCVMEISNQERSLLEATMSNPKYESDLSKLVGNYDLSNIANDETILIVTGCFPVAELLDRPVAELIRDEIDRRGAPSPYRRGIIIGDLWWYRDEALQSRPVISVGGPNANPLSGAITDEGIPWKIEGVYGRIPDGEAPRVAVWGQEATDVRAVADLFLENEEGLKRFLKMCWK